ncbi:MAG: phosphohistidine phosphatase, sixa [Verrucomicrobiaceae bacterium]|nr:phosphohistidine phosphatase, sixa [Verrucomicrobiaceae bacterium]
MKYLTVIRHAKSSWDQPGVSDHDRTLNERGLRAAPAVGRFLQGTYFGGNDNAPLMPVPERIIASTAERALKTAQCMREAFRLPPAAMRLDSRLYLAPSTVILDVVRDGDEDCRHMVLVGHNPGIHEFCDRILARASIPRMPTCTAVIIGLPHEYWGLADWQEAQLIAYATPKALERRFPVEYKGISKEVGDD